MILILSQNGIIVRMSQPLVSVIIPVYNTSISAVRLISALLKDKYQNLEIIVVNDGSTDNTPELLKKLKDPRLQIIRQKNAGVSAARNRGIELSSGDYLIFIDSDDEVSKDFVSELVKTIQKPNTALAVTGHTYYRVKEKTSFDFGINPVRKRKNTESFRAYILYLLLLGRLNSTFNKIFHADVIRNNQLRFDQKMIFAEDTKFVLDYLAHSKDEIIRFIPKPLYKYYYGTETSNSKSSASNWKNWQMSYNNLKKWLGKHSSFIEKIRLRQIYFHWRRSCFTAKLRNIFGRLK